MRSFLLFIALLFATTSFAQTVFWTDDFESATATTLGGGTRTPEENGGVGSPMTAYFTRTDGTTVSQSVSFTGKQSTYYWAGEDHNAAGTGFTASGAQGAATNSTSNELQILWSGINISGKTGLSFKGLFAANSTNEPWDNTNACISGVGTTNTDYIIVQYSIDGGAFVDLIRFFNRGSASGTGDKYLFEDTDGNGCGDGTQLTNAFGEFTKTIAGTGTTMSLKILVYCEGSNEEWGIDNFRLFATPTCTAPTITGNPSNRSICVNGNTTFTATATGVTAYQWQVNTGSGFTDISNGGVYSNVTTSTLTITGATAGMNGYQYRCTAINGVASCFTNSNAGTLSISSITSSTAQNNVACFGTASGSAAVSPTGGIGSYTYSWAPSGGTASIATGLAVGSYTCTITDAISCQITKTVTITQPSALSVTALSKTNVSCFGGSNGAASINTPTGGAGGYAYNWTPGNPTGDGTVSVTGLTTGVWTCTVTDANSCQATQTFNITQPTAISVTPATQTNVACNGGTTGAASINTPTGGAGGYTYNWTPGNPTGDGTVSVTGLTTGVWTCTVTDANTCTATQTFNITQPTALTVTPASQTNVACFGGSNGAASINTPTGGAGGYTYNWTPGNPAGDGTVSVTGLLAGSWTCTITDANSCQATQTFNITSPTALTVTPASQTNIACFGGSNGAASINTPTGGAGGYTYNWTPGNPTGDGTVSVTGLVAGTWTCTVTDANTCQAIQTFNITSPTALVVTSASQTNITCNGGSNGAASINTPTGGAGGYTYNWTPGNPTGDGTVSVTGLTTGVWTCTVTDANTCQTTQTFNITQPTGSSWTGAISTDWNSASNWCGAVPTSTTDVSFSAGAPNYPVITGSVAVKNIAVNSLSSLTITGTLQIAGTISNSGTITATNGTVELNGTTAQSIPVNTFSSNTIKNLIVNNSAGVTVGGPLNITGTLTPTAGVLTTGGFVTLKSTATGTGRIGTGSTSGGYISGSINAEKYIVGGGFASATPSRRGYRFISHPFTTAIALSQLSGEIDITGAGGATNGFDPTITNNPSAFYYVTATGNGSSSNDPGWTAFTSATTTTWNKGQGIRLFVRGDKGQGLDFNSSTLQNDYAVGNPTLTFSGNINQGDQTINLVNAGANWNLVGNPFASPVDLNLVTRNNTSNFIYVWNTNVGLRGGYSAAIDVSAGTYKLPAYSAFFTQSTGASPSIVFTEASKAATSTSNVLFRQTSTANTLKLKLESSDGLIFWDEWMLNLNDKRNSNKEDGFDAYKLINNDVNLYSNTKDNYRLSIDARNYEADAIVPLTIQSVQQRSLTIKVTEANIAAGQELYLYDKDLKTYTKLDLNVSYTFTSNTNANSRFEIVMKKGVRPLTNNENIMVNVYPNPAKANTTLEYNALKAGKLTVTVFNVEGKQMDVLNFGEQQTGKLTLNTAKYAKGTYTLKIQIGDELITKQLVKE